MKPTPHDLLDELIAAALHGELTPEEHTAFESRLQHDAAARAAYQETQLMHDLLEKTNREAQPDLAFEQRMVSGVRRKIQHGAQPNESAWESVLVLWRVMRDVLGNKWVVRAGFVCAVVAVGALAFSNFQGSGSTGPIFALAMPGKESHDLLKTLLPVSHQEKHSELDANAVKSQLRQSFEANADESKASRNSDAVPLLSPQVPTSDMQTDEQRQAPAAPAAPGSVSDGSMADDDTPKSPLSRIAGTTPATPAPAAKALEAFNGKPADPSPTDTRKLIRNAQLDLEVKSYQSAVDQITAMTNAAGGYLDTSNSQRGGNGKLQGTVVAKVLPQNLDAFLLKLRALGDVQNQSVSTDDVTKEYFDTQARLDNSRRMETQLQQLLEHANSKIADLLQVERELERVRGDIEQMQGQLKLYDFQVQFATVTISVQEKDLNQAAAYLLQEKDDFALFSTDVEGTFQQARHAADEFKGQVLNANLNHNSGSDVSAQLVVSIPPDQIDAFLGEVRGLGRVANFTRQTNRVAKDGGNSDQPADETRTEKDRVLVNLSIRSDDEMRKQVALTVVTSRVDDALDQAKTAALAAPGAEIVSSSLSKTPQGQSTAQVSVRVPGKNYPALLAVFKALGRTSSFSLQRDDNSGPNSTGDDAPVLVALTLTDDETPLQQTEMVVQTTDVDAKAQSLKKDAAASGVEVKASSFERDPNGIETAEMTLRLPLSKYAAFLEKLKNVGKVETLTVQRQDRPDQALTDDSAPAEISLQLHSESPIVADNNGLWATLRRTLGASAAALFGSVATIGVVLAFFLPWTVLLIIAAWIARRIYVRRSRGKEVRRP